MTDKTNSFQASVFVPHNQQRGNNKSDSSPSNGNLFLSNATYRGTPNSSDYISMANRRAYTYNEKK